jgi:hypothetical protein
LPEEKYQDAAEWARKAHARYSKMIGKKQHVHKGMVDALRRKLLGQAKDESMIFSRDYVEKLGVPIGK